MPDANQPTNFPPIEFEDFDRDTDAIWELVRDEYVPKQQGALDVANQIAIKGFPNFMRLFMDEVGDEICNVKLKFHLERARKRAGPKDTDELLKAKALAAYYFVNCDEPQAWASMNTFTDITFAWCYMRWEIISPEGGWTPVEPWDYADIKRHIEKFPITTENGKTYTGIHSMKVLWENHPARKPKSDAKEAEDAIKWRASQAGKTVRAYNEELASQRDVAQQVKREAKLLRNFPSFAKAASDGSRPILKVEWKGITEPLSDRANAFLLDRYVMFNR